MRFRVAAATASESYELHDKHGVVELGVLIQGLVYLHSSLTLLMLYTVKEYKIDFEFAEKESLINNLFYVLHM